jgi:protoporphyrinogen oxidase
MSDDTRRVDVVIIGGGIAGLLVAGMVRDAGLSHVVLEQQDTLGGHCRSFAVEGFTFDYGIHGLYDPKNTFDSHALGLDDVEEADVSVEIAALWRTVVAPHPAYAHLAHLPRAAALRGMLGFLYARMRRTGGRDSNFRDWARSRFGGFLADTLIVPYVEKFWCTDASALTPDWIGERVKVPSVRGMIRGLATRQYRSPHYVRSIRYPARCGFGAYVDALARGVEASTSCEVLALDTGARQVTLRNGGRIEYRHVVSTVPLPDFCRILIDCPADVRDAATVLSATTCTLVSMGFGGAAPRSFHWAYALDRDVAFSRVSLPGNWSASNAPPGYWSVQAEVYSRGEPPSASLVGEQVLAGLARYRLRAPDELPVVMDVRAMKYANVVFDGQRQGIVERIRHVAEANGVLLCGRYARWDYSLVPDILADARQAAGRLLEHERDLEAQGMASHAS